MILRSMGLRDSSGDIAEHRCGSGGGANGGEVTVRRGGDWYAGPSAIANLLATIRERTGSRLPSERRLSLR